MAKIKFVEDNTAPTIQLTIKRESLPVNLTGASVDLIIKNSTSGEITNVGDQACTITDAADGVIEYDPNATDFPSAGTYVCDVEITYADATVEVVYEQLTVEVRAKN